MKATIAKIDGNNVYIISAQDISSFVVKQIEKGVIGNCLSDKGMADLYKTIAFNSVVTYNIVIENGVDACNVANAIRITLYKDFSIAGSKFVEEVYKQVLKLLLSIVDEKRC